LNICNQSKSFQDTIKTRHCAKTLSTLRRHAECRVLIVTLSIVILSIVTLRIAILSIAILSIAILSIAILSIDGQEMWSTEGI